MRYFVSVIESRPLRIHFSLHNPPESEAPVYVPKPLGPLGAFVRLAVADATDQVVYRSATPKIALKLDPARPESYLALDPGYTHGIVLDVADLRLPPGDYRLHLTYSSLPYRGFPDHPPNELTHETTLPLRLD